MNQPIAAMRKLLLVNLGSPSQVLLSTAAVRDLHAAYPGRFLTDVYSECPEIWEHHPQITKMAWHVEPLSGPRDMLARHEEAVIGREFKIVKEDPELEVVFCEQAGEHPSSITQSNRGAYHAIHSYAHDLGAKLGVDFEASKFCADIHISAVEQSWMSQLEEIGIRDSFWIVHAGGSRDMPARRWPTDCYQEVIEAYRGKITFVQVGRANEGHPALRHVVNLVGKTNLRQLIRLMYHATGVLCAPSLMMHLAAAVPLRLFDNQRRRNPQHRQCVVVAGGREPWQWYNYSTHQSLHTNGMLPCCASGGCWRTNVKPVALGALPDDDCCVTPVRTGNDVLIPKCMQMITPEMVIERVGIAYEGGALWYNEATTSTVVRST